MTKQLICDYCGNRNEPKAIFSAQKSFVGHKMLDLLQIVTQKTLPANLAVKVCLMCASNLMATKGVIEKVLKLVENASLGKGKNKKAAIEEEEKNETSEGLILDIPKVEKKTPKKPVAKLLRLRSKSMASRPSDLTFPTSPITDLFELDVSPSKKSPKKHASRIEDTLEDSVRLTPAKEVAPIKKAFKHLFGSGNGDAAAPESEDEDEDEIDGEENTDKVIAIKKGFECKLCDFQAKFAKPFKEHLFQVHGQQRPRIYFCDLCPKSFGILRSWKVHMNSAHGVTVEAPQKEAKGKVAKAKEQQTKDVPQEQINTTEKSVKEKSNKTNKEIKDTGSQEPQLATIRALNGEKAAKKKWLENAINTADYTFAVNGSSASTPKGNDHSVGLSTEFKCDICDSELATVKQMQEHMKTAHAIDKPKIFKCQVCDKSLTTKQSWNHHMNLHSAGTGAEKPTKRKILQENDVEQVDGTAQEDDEKPREEKILRITAEENTSSIKNIATDSADESNLMAPPSKKPKKAKNSISQDQQAAIINISDSPSKKNKNKDKKSPKKTNIVTVDLLDEINTNVKPHKKTRLVSVGDSICSSVDGYSTADESVLSCNQCGKHVKSHQRLAAHIQKRHGTKLECPACKSTYQNQRDYVNHFAVCSSEGALLPCGVATCKKSFYQASFLSTHLRHKHQWS